MWPHSFSFSPKGFTSTQFISQPTESRMKISFLIVSLCYMYQQSQAITVKTNIGRTKQSPNGGLSTQFEPPVDCVPRSRFLQRLLQGHWFYSQMCGGKCIVKLRYPPANNLRRYRNVRRVVCITIGGRKFCSIKTTKEAVSVGWFWWTKLKSSNGRANSTES